MTDGPEPRGQRGAFGDVLRALREARSLTQEELADRAGITVKAVGALERGERRRPYPHTVRSLAAALALDGADADRLVGAVPGRRTPEAGEDDAAPAPAPAPQHDLVGRDRELADVLVSLNPTRARAVRVSDPRPVVHPLRAVDTAAWSIADLPHGRRRITIDHSPLPGVTPADLLWWFTHIDGTVDYGGTTVRRYLAWHPLDHILWELARPAPDGTAGEGARFRIVERFGDSPVVEIVDRVEKLDATGIRLVQRRFGVKVFQLEHTWSAGPDGTHYVSVMDIGARQPWLAPLNRWLTTRAMPVALCRAWVKHNVEEVGQLPWILPGLLAGVRAGEDTAAARS